MKLLFTRKLIPLFLGLSLLSLPVLLPVSLSLSKGKPDISVSAVYAQDGLTGGAGQGEPPVQPPPQVSTSQSQVTKQNPFDNCGWNVVCGIKWFIWFVGDIIISLLSRLLAAAGLLLNYAIFYSVVEFSQRISEVGIIDSAWATFRDVANLMFIFGLLLIAASSVLQVETYGAKKLLGILVVMALLVNFSLFITKFTIDISNIIAIQFNNAIVVCKDAVCAQNAQQISTGSTPTNAEADAGKAKLGVANVFYDAFKLQEFWKGIASQQNTNPNILFQLFATLILSVIFIFIAVFVFTAAAVMLIVRLVALVFLMVLSPLAFAGLVIPQTAKYAGDWWRALFSNAFYAPLFMMLLWFTAQIATNPFIKKNFGGNGSFNEFATAIGSEGPQTVGIIFYFLLINFALVACILIAKKLSVAGADLGMKAGSIAAFALPAFAGRRTLGLAGSILARQPFIKNWASGKDVFGNRVSFTKKMVGTGLARTSRALSQSSFDVRAPETSKKIIEAVGLKGVLGEAGGKGGYQAVLDKQVKRKEEFAKYLKPDEIEKANITAGFVSIKGAAEKDKAAAASESSAAAQERDAARQRVRDAQIVVNAAPPGSAAQRAAQIDLAQRQREFADTENRLTRAMQRLASATTKLEGIEAQEKRKRSGAARLEGYAERLETLGTAAKSRYINIPKFLIPAASTIAAERIKAGIKQSERERIIDAIEESMKPKTP